MNIDLIKMPRGEARAEFLKYKRSVGERHTAEDEAVMKGYQALAEGSALLDLRSAIRTAGQDNRGRPRVAITRADFKWCWFSWLQGSEARFLGTVSDSRNEWDGEVKPWKHNTVIVPPTVLTRPEGEDGRNRWRALVPYIPPALRPKAKLSNYHIMWEAEWQPVPPTDPFLLKHLGGTLYVVLAQWDLTPLEKAVLAGRLTS